ncbi:hypothetical protein [Aquimarina spongiae]|uniref:Predicted 5' DNA nuclease, flap endonuclease-1-like, helix-3-turn-helix (H3TH) domain n=1 Tax=Aquimarina spongiae TaxID=570521 RepID=A0A1M6APU3_9FLAO|nr:hypothetical protein [Aquimarina spongiae]SHI38451.1 Predicted 5' DNA nuclease, flap endonuclease-1-like, helix-3-turn-helix (H3TH) domain [Aquimarina spongiae]
MLEFLNEANWWCLLLLLFLAFLLGWLLSRWALKNKYKAELEECQRQNSILKNAEYTKAKSTFSNKASSETEIKAIKTRDQGGIPISSTPAHTGEQPKLNFASFGEADASQKDDLKLISGIGPFIEEKLNGIGIYTFDQISRFTAEDIETVTQLIQFFPGRIERDHWTKQAEKLKQK